MRRRIGTDDGTAYITTRPSRSKMCNMAGCSRLALLSSMCALVSFSEAFQSGRKNPSAPAHRSTNSAPAGCRIGARMHERSICSTYALGDHLGRCNNGRVSLQLAAKPKATSASGGGKTRRKRRSGTSSAAKAAITTTSTKQSVEQQTKSSRRKSPIATPRPKRVGRPSTKADSSWYQRTELLNHRVLSREEELELGRRIAVATALREKLIDLADNRRVERELYGDRRWQVAEGMADMGDYDERELPRDDASVQFLPSDEELFQLGMGSSFSLVQAGGSSQNSEDNDNDLLMSEDGGFTIMDQETGEIAEVDGMGYMYNNDRNRDDDIPIALQEGSKFAMGRVERDLAELSNEEVVEIMGVGGGKAEVRTTLRMGAEARRELMKCNIRLVVSIAKKWIKGSPAQLPNGSGNLRELYEGGWDRPSLDEVIQEGILGLSRAIDKYDYQKGLKFSTYSTWWIQNYVRVSFQTAKTGPLKLPAQFYQLKNRYLKSIAELTREGRPIPPLEDFAVEFGTSIKRLQHALSATESLFSIDQPLEGQSTKLRGSSAGEIGVGNNELCFSDALVCDEPRPEEFVELSFLRQSLENALATELSPHERDVVRLRLGLDDGKARTAKEVAAICGDMIKAEHVRRAEKRAFKKLSSPSSLYQHHLQDYLYLVGGALDDDFALKVFR